MNGFLLEYPPLPVRDEDEEDWLPEPVIPIEMLRQALEEDRLVSHIAPIVQLPQRRTHGYDLVPRLLLEDAELAASSARATVLSRRQSIAQAEARIEAERVRRGRADRHAAVRAHLVAQQLVLRLAAHAR